MPTFIRSTVIRASVQALYDFHLDTNNVRLVQPPGFAVEKVEMPATIEAGSEIRLTVRVLGLVRQKWLVQWAEVSPPQGTPLRGYLIDTLLEGPFPAFAQEHLFVQEGEGARLTDRVTFLPPFGPLGWLLLPLIYGQLHFMFAWRHRRTRELLEEQPCL